MNSRLLIVLAPFFGAVSPVHAWLANQPADLVLGSPSPPALSSFTSARAMAVDPVSGKLFVSDEARVLRFASAKKLLTGAPAEAVLGKPRFTAPLNSQKAASNLTGPRGLAIDAAGHLWVADEGRLLRWDDAANRSSGASADGVLGGPDFTSTYSSGDGKLGFLMSLAVDAAGNLYVSNADRHSIVRFNAAASKANGAVPDAVFGQSSFTATGSGISSTRLNTPGNIAISGSTLWVHDSANRRVLRLDNAATRTNGAAFDAVLGQDSFFSSSSSAADAPAMAVTPSGDLLLAAPGTALVRGWSSPSTLNGLLPAPGYSWSESFGPGFKSLCAEPGGRLWVGGSIAQSFDSNTVPVRRVENFAGAATVVSTLGIPAASGHISSPWQCAVDPVSGKVFVTDLNSHRMFRFASQASLASNAQPEATFGDGVQVASPTSLASPRGLCFDPSGRLWVADSGFNRVLRFDTPATMLSFAPASAVIGQSNLNSSVFNPVSEASITNPYGVAADATGTLWVLDYNHARVLRFDNAASKSGLVGAEGILGKDDFYSPWSSGLPGRFYQPTRLQVDAAGRLWIMDTGGVNESTGSTGYDVRLFRYDNPKAKAPGAMPEATIKFPFAYPGQPAQAFAVAPDGVLWVADGSTQPVISRFDNAATVVTGATPDGQLGTGYPDITAAGFGGSMGALHCDPAGNLWVADIANRRVARFSKTPPSLPGAAGSVISVSRMGGKFSFQFTAETGSDYLLETSADLVQWTNGTAFLHALTPVESFTANDSGTRRFYRARKL